MSFGGYPDDPFFLRSQTSSGIRSEPPLPEGNTTPVAPGEADTSTFAGLRRTYRHALGPYSRYNPWSTSLRWFLMRLRVPSEPHHDVSGAAFVVRAGRYQVIAIGPPFRYRMCATRHRYIVMPIMTDPWNAVAALGIRDPSQGVVRDEFRSDVFWKMVEESPGLIDLPFPPDS